MPFGVKFDRPVEVVDSFDIRSARQAYQTIVRHSVGVLGIDMLVPSGEVWFVEWGQMFVTTSAVAGTRYPNMMIFRGTDFTWRVFGKERGPSERSVTNFTPDAPFADDGTTLDGLPYYSYLRPLPRGPYFGGDSVDFRLNGFQAGDQLDVNMVVRVVT